MIQTIKRISVLLGRVVLAACAAPTAPPPNISTPAAEFSDAYRIGVSDTLAVNVWRNEDLSVEVPVRPDGKISVPLEPTSTWVTARQNKLAWPSLSV